MITPRVKFVSTLPASTKQLGQYTVTYTVFDGVNQTTSAVRIVNIIDTVAPTVTMNGNQLLYIEAPNVFNDPSVTAVDDVDGPITPVRTGVVSTSMFVVF